MTFTAEGNWRSVWGATGSLLPVLACAIAAIGGPFGPAVGVAAEPQFKVPPGQRQLFLDDHGVEKMENLTRTMHQPDKKGAVIRPDPSIPDVRSIQIRTAPIWDPRRKIWKLWDLSTPNSLHAKGLRCGGYHESKDGLHWTGPSWGRSNTEALDRTTTCLS